MGLYNNIVQFDYNIQAGEHISWIFYPFRELKMDPIFKVISIDLESFKADIEVVRSDFLPIGRIYIGQPLEGFRRVKLTAIDPDFTYIDAR